MTRYKGRSYGARYTVTPAAPSTTTIHTAITLPSSGTTTVTTGITNPDVPRCVSITGNASGITGNVVITGTNMLGQTITDTIVADGTTTVQGAKAFLTVTSIVVPVRNAPSDTIAIGRGTKLGLPVTLPHNTVIRTFYNNTLEGTPPTVATSGTAIESNTALLNTTLAGAVVDLYYLR